MTAGHQPQIEQLLLNLLPADGSTLGNAKLFEQVHAAAKAAGLRCSEQDFAARSPGGEWSGDQGKGPRWLNGTHGSGGTWQ